MVEATQLAFAGEPVEFSVEQLTEVAPVDRAHYCSNTEIIVGNPVAEVEVRTAPDGTILSSKITKSSGVKSWDDAVLRAIEKTEVLPRDLDGRVPSPMIIALRPVG